MWTQKQLTRLRRKYAFEVLSLGRQVFLERIHTLNFEAWAGLTKVKSALNRVQQLGLTALVAKFILFLRAWTPIILTLKKH